MSDTSIDESKLPGVKEVCRDFAVLEDHTLAHNLQEQEIEHHLASNIQRTRLVQHDLLVARKLQEEEDLKARVRIQKRHKHLDHQDSEIAQEIQEKLVIEAEERRRQEEKDEDIARILQEKERKEKRKQKKQQAEHQGHEPYEDGYYRENRDGSRGRHKEYEHDRPRRHRSHERHHKPLSESRHSQSRFYVAESEQQCPSEENSGKPHGEREARRAHRDGEHCDRPNLRSERPTRPALPRSIRDLDMDIASNSGKHRSHSQDNLCSRIDDEGRHRDSEALKKREPRNSEHCYRTAPPRAPSPHNGRAQHNQRDPDMGSRGMRDTTYGKMQADVKHLEQLDAQMARKLQEEELRATRSDKQAAQVAQDEEIARLLMTEEKKAYKRAKMLEKIPSDKRRQELEWQPDAIEHAHPRSRDTYEVHASKNDKPARPPPPPSLSDHAGFESKRSTRPAAKSESTYKGSSHWQ